MIGKTVVEAAKKGIPMAGQKLSEFFTKEAIGKGMLQAGNVAKEVGKQVMKAPGAIRTGAEKVGSVASSVGSEAAKEVGRIGMDIGGAVGGREGAVAAGKGVKKVGELLRTPYAVNTGVGIAAEQLIPRAMGRQAPNLGESFVRQATSQGIGMPVSAGLQAGGVGPTIAGFGGQLAGQVAGQMATDAILPGRQQYPVDFGEGPTTPTGATKHTAEPEYSQVVRPSTRDLSAVQAQEAITEREKYEYRLKLAQIEKMPSTVMHMNPDSGMQSLNSLAQSMMRVHNF